MAVASAGPSAMESFLIFFPGNTFVQNIFCGKATMIHDVFEFQGLRVSLGIAISVVPFAECKRSLCRGTMGQYEESKERASWVISHADDIPLVAATLAKQVNCPLIAKGKMRRRSRPKSSLPCAARVVPSECPIRSGSHGTICVDTTSEIEYCEKECTNCLEVAGAADIGCIGGHHVPVWFAKCLAAPYQLLFPHSNANRHRAMSPESASWPVLIRADRESGYRCRHISAKVIQQILNPAATSQ